MKARKRSAPPAPPAPAAPAAPPPPAAPRRPGMFGRNPSPAQRAAGRDRAAALRASRRQASRVAAVRTSWASPRRDGLPLAIITPPPEPAPTASIADDSEE